MLRAINVKPGRHTASVSGLTRSVKDLGLKAAAAGGFLQ